MADIKKPSENDKTVNGSFTFKGAGAYELGELFLVWCKEQETNLTVELISNRVDYNSPRLK